MFFLHMHNVSGLTPVRTMVQQLKNSLGNNILQQGQTALRILWFCELSFYIYVC